MGSFGDNVLRFDSLDDALRSLPSAWEITDKYTPPILDCDHSDCILAYDLCHFACAHSDFLHEKTGEVCEAVLRSGIETTGQDMKEQVVEFTSCISLANRTGPSFANFHLILARIKKALDPNNIANPRRLIDMEATEKTEK